MPERYRMTRLDDLERVPLDHGDWRPIRRPLGVTAFAINAYSAAKPGEPLIEPHDETSAGAGAHQELYFVAAGAASFVVDGDELDAPAGTMIVVEPGAHRQATAAADDTTVLVIGGRPGSALPPSPFEYWYSAIPAERDGDFERACEIVAEGLEEHPGHGTMHYALGAYSARLGRRDQALDHLRTAFANDPRTREWASDDEDLDSIRDELASL